MVKNKLIKIELEKDYITHIIDQLENYGIIDYHKSFNDEIEKVNETICKLLQIKITKYPKSCLISPSIKMLG